MEKTKEFMQSFLTHSKTRVSTEQENDQTVSSLKEYMKSINAPKTVVDAFETDVKMIGLVMERTKSCLQDIMKQTNNELEDNVHYMRSRNEAFEIISSGDVKDDSFLASQDIVKAKSAFNKNNLIGMIDFIVEITQPKKYRISGSSKNEEEPVVQNSEEGVKPVEHEDRISRNLKNEEKPVVVQNTNEDDKPVGLEDRISGNPKNEDNTYVKPNMKEKVEPLKSEDINYQMPYHIAHDANKNAKTEEQLEGKCENGGVSNMIRIIAVFSLLILIVSILLPVYVSSEDINSIISSLIPF